jgi:alanine dehydrogenase
MSRATATEVSPQQKLVVTGILGVLGVVLLGFGAAQAETVSIAIGGGALVIALATYSAMGET